MERKHLSIEIPKTLWAALKIQAVKEGRSLTKMVVEVMGKYLASKKGDK